MRNIAEIISILRCMTELTGIITLTILLVWFVFGGEIQITINWSSAIQLYESIKNYLGQ